MRVVSVCPPSSPSTPHAAAADHHPSTDCEVIDFRFPRVGSLCVLIVGDLETEYNCVEKEEGSFSIYRYSIELPRSYSEAAEGEEKFNAGEQVDNVPRIHATPCQAIQSVWCAPE